MPSAPSAVKQEQSQPQPSAQPTAPAAAKPADQTTADPTPAAPDTTKNGNASSGSILETPAETQNNSNPDFNIPVRVNEVNVVFTVTDRHGRLIKDLGRDDFKVVDDGRAGARIPQFSTRNQPAITGRSAGGCQQFGRDRFKFEQDSAIEFLSQTIRPTYDQAFVVGFDATPEVTQDFTDSNEALSKGVRMLRPGGGTAMFDAHLFCLPRQTGQTAAQRRATYAALIVLISDGDDNQSHVTREEAIEMAQRAEVIIYTISTNIT